MNNPEISTKLQAHYATCFETHGATVQGVDWGLDTDRHLASQRRMLNVVRSGEPAAPTRPSLLDVGCGYGHLYSTACDLSIPLDYHGIDLCADMIATARARHPSATWHVGDLFGFAKPRSFDYLVSNGVLTQKLDVPFPDMDRYARTLVQAMFAACRCGIAFNLMTTRVNFTQSHLYYKSPVEFLAWCMEEVTPCVRLDHSYRAYDYTLYLYRDEVFGAAGRTGVSA